MIPPFVLNKKDANNWLLSAHDIGDDATDGAALGWLRSALMGQVGIKTWARMGSGTRWQPSPPHRPPASVDYGWMPVVSGGHCPISASSSPRRLALWKT